MITWAQRYQTAARRLQALRDVETDDLVRQMLDEAAAKMSNAYLEHAEIEARKTWPAAYK